MGPYVTCNLLFMNQRFPFPSIWWPCFRIYVVVDRCIQIHIFFMAILDSRLAIASTFDSCGPCLGGGVEIGASGSAPVSLSFCQPVWSVVARPCGWWGAAGAVTVTRGVPASAPVAVGAWRLGVCVSMAMGAGRFTRRRCCCHPQRR